MINVHMIQKIEDSKRQIKKEIYKKIYEQFNRKIIASVQCNQKQVLLQVPSFLLGYPTFDARSAAVYLKRQLENAGFTVEYLSTTSFHVSWVPKQSKGHSGSSSGHIVLPEYENQQTIEDQDFPSLVNLKKIANRYRQSPSPA